jgi:SAM-dependent methyltransferase
MQRCLKCETTFTSSQWICPSCGFAPQAAGGLRSFCVAHGKDGFDPQAFAFLAELERGSFWFESRNLLIAWAVKRCFPSARSLLEIGCGTGFVLAGLGRACPQLRLTGAELHSEGLHYAQRRLPGVDLLQFDARQIPFAGEFDLIGAFDVLEHIDDDVHILAEMHRAIKPRGGALITVPQHRWLWSAADDYAEHKRRYSRSALLAKLSATGFGVRRMTSFVSFLLPAIAAVRLGERFRSRPFDPVGDLTASHRAPVTLRHIMATERALIARGFDFPVGVSLLIVADRL